MVAWDRTEARVHVWGLINGLGVWTKGKPLKGRGKEFRARALMFQKLLLWDADRRSGHRLPGDEIGTEVTWTGRVVRSRRKEMGRGLVE